MADPVTEVGSASGVSATQAQADANAKADINTAEAQDRAVFGDNSSWSHNLKRLADVYTSRDLELAREYEDLNLQRARNAQTLWENTYGQLLLDQAEIRRRSLAQFDDRSLASHQENQRTVRQGDLASDRQWNIDEVSDLSAKSGLQADAIAATVIKAIADALSDKIANKTA